jgi:hypothetical protein
VLIFICFVSGCRRSSDCVYVRAEAKNFSFVLNPRTNTIESIMIVPVDMTMGGETVAALILPKRLWEKKTLTWENGECLYDFIERIGKLYDFPIRWEPELHASKKEDEASAGVGRRLEDWDFFDLFAYAVAEAQEMGFQHWPKRGHKYDPNSICVGIIAENGAVVKTVRTLTEFQSLGRYP